MFTFLRKTKLTVLFTAAAVAAGCGVKNDPVPPESPVEMSRGKPNYKDDSDKEKSPATKKKETETND